MIRAIIETSALNDILRTLYRLLDIRITFFDLSGEELAAFDIKPISEFCRHRRCERAFNARCERCDSEHLSIAKRMRSPHIYVCHAGLYEAIVPLYNGATYLGALVYGQVRPADAASKAGAGRDYRALPKKDRTYMEDIAALLKTISEYILAKEILRYRKLPWLAEIESYIRAHLDAPIALTDLARVSRRSASFISHYFKKENGLSPMRFIARVKMARAKTLLAEGLSVRETAGMLGFYDEFHFSKAFKRENGVPPSHYSRPETAAKRQNKGASLGIAREP